MDDHTLDHGVVQLSIDLDGVPMFLVVKTAIAIYNRSMIMTCGIVLRVSSQKQAEKWSLQTQREMALAYVQKQGWNWEIYEDVKSGKNINERVEFSRLINDIQDKKIQAVWAVEFERITRDDEDAAFFKKLCIEYDVNVIIKDTELKFKNADDEMFFTIRGAVAKYERKKIIERVTRALRTKKDSGQWKNVHQYGYNRNQDGTVSINEEQAEVIRRVYRLFIEGKKYPTICKTLSKEGIKRLHGSDEWMVSQIMNILKNPVFIGKTRGTDGSLVPSNLYEAIIKESDWETVQLMMAHSYTNEQPRNRTGDYELSGIPTCSLCGFRYFHSDTAYRHARRSHVTERNCDTPKKQISAHFLERITMAVILDCFSGYDTVEALNSFLHPTQDNKIDLAPIQSKLAELKLKKEKIVDLITDEIITREDAKRKMGEINKQIQEVEAEFTKAQLSTEPKDYITLLDAFAEDLLFHIWDMTPRQRKELYKEIISELKVNPTDGQLEYLIVDRIVVMIDYKNPSQHWLNQLEIIDTYYN